MVNPVSCKPRRFELRRHIVDLGFDGLIFIYDELEADKPVTWSYLLHSTLKPITYDTVSDGLHIQTTNGVGASDAYLYGSTHLSASMTDQFFAPAINWLRADDNGHFAPYPNHWHFTAVSPKSQYYHFATIIDTHANTEKSRAPKVWTDGKMEIGGWTIELNLKANAKGYFHVVNKKTGAEVKLTDKGTVIKDAGKSCTLVDQLPQLEI